MTRPPDHFSDSLTGPVFKTLSSCGCTIMGDGWTDVRQRNLINFLVYSPMGIAFVKSIDASDAVKDATLFSKLFLEVIEWVRVSNVVHMVTDNGANYKAAGGLVNATYKSINWSPCAAHCLNLILSEISKMNHVHELAIKASKVTRYIYNRSWLLARLRKKKSWTEIVRPGATRFATTFLALHSIHEHMHDLQALVTSKEFASSRFAKEKKGKDAIDIILDKQFWKDCFIIVKIVEPLMCLLRIVDGDEKPSMGYVYEGMYREIKGIKDIFKRNKRLYRPYTTIIKTRWDDQLRNNIHAATYWLNPTFQYDQASFCKKPEVMNSVLDVIETKATSSKTKLMDELRLFRDRQDSFGRELAIITSKKTQPDSVLGQLFGQQRSVFENSVLQLVNINYIPRALWVGGRRLNRSRNLIDGQAVFISLPLVARRRSRRRSVSVQRLSNQWFLNSQAEVLVPTTELNISIVQSNPDNMAGLKAMMR
ncbi:uncharacterized protein LOC114282793 [Camellia sinensis]|uniref:uncharacterized protein LOC114282793 n=1 Tax=Camellia sinensis TaxID=4442 RepID=UPI001036DA47|nr:uncharacterized protein LOC114282793 [Camellia sinensis]